LISEGKITEGDDIRSDWKRGSVTLWVYIY